MQALRGPADPLLDPGPRGPGAAAWGWGLGSLRLGLGFGVGLGLGGLGRGVLAHVPCVMCYVLRAISYAILEMCVFPWFRAHFAMCYKLCVVCHVLCILRNVCISWVLSMC